MTEKSVYIKPTGMRRFFSVLFVSLMLTGGAHAQSPLPIAGGGSSSSTTPTSPCDMEYYDSLKSRAWLEAQREITQNQNLIFKPDSVLQYTCFDQFIGSLGSKATSMFSDNPMPRGGQPLSSSLDSIVRTAVNTYLNANFGHDMLGGRSGIKHQPSSSTSYNCTMMNEVWKKAKCMNFAVEANDGFFTFAQHNTPPDKRLFPKPDGGCTGSNLWATEIPKATGAATTWKKDPVKTFFKEMTECKSDQSISTGIIKSLGLNGGRLEERFCIPPGCSYVAGSRGALGTCQSAAAATPTPTPSP